MALAFSKLGQMGRLGNSCFQVAAMMGLAHSSGRKLNLPPWKYAKFFKGKHPEGPQRGHQLKEPAFHYCGNFIPNDDKDYDVSAYLQSEKYWKAIEPDIREHFEWEPGFLESVRQKYAGLLNDTTIAIHVRRGDYLNDDNYEVLPVTYYHGALERYFPDWRDRKLLVFSDDLPWCRVHFGCLENATVVPPAEDIEHLCLLSQCNSLILSNSTFAWWGGWMAEKHGAVVVRPEKYTKRLALNESDIWPERWLVAKNSPKIDLSDCTFTIPVTFDHPDRKDNLGLTVCLLQKNFDCKIIVMEQGGSRFGHFPQWCRYEKYGGSKFRRTLMLNEMAKMSDTPFICNYDADVTMPPLQMLEAVRLLRAGADMVFPYDGRFARLERNPWFKKLEKFLDIGIVGDGVFDGMKATDNLNSVGGCVLFNRQSFLDGGGENERIVIWGPEDSERALRFPVLGFSMKRTKGCLFHINHFVGTNSGNNHPYVESNREEWRKVQGMDKDELWAYVRSWPWRISAK